MSARWLRLLILLLAVAVLELLCQLDIIDRLSMQPPHQMAIDLVHLLASGALNKAMLRTTSNVLIAFGLALVCGIILASLIHRAQPLREALDLVFSTWYAVPILAFYPLLIVVFGLGNVPNILTGFMQGVVAVIVSVLDGLDRVPRVLGK